MARKFKLDFTPEYDFILLGLVSFEKDYRLGWELNHALHMDFVRADDHSLKHRKTGLIQQFSSFYYADDEACTYYKLLSNRSDSGYLLEEFKNLDYFLVITGEFEDQSSVLLREKLLGLESVQACFILDPESIKEYPRLMG